MHYDWLALHPYMELDATVRDSVLGRGRVLKIGKGSRCGLGHQSLMSDLGVALPVVAWTDSSAALGIASRSGLGKMRHLETHTL